MNRANATLLAAFFHFDTSLMVWVILGPLALFILVSIALGVGNGAVFQIVPERFGKEIGIVTGIVGTFLRRTSTSYAFAIEEG